MNLKDNIEIRVGLKEEYIPMMVEAENACFSDPWSEAAFRSELLNPYSLYVVAVSGGRIVGYVGGIALYENCDITNVAVLPEMRRRGIASAMVECFINECASRSVEQILLEVRQSNLPAIKLYESFGFRAYGTRKNYYEKPAEDAVLMVVALC